MIAPRVALAAVVERVVLGLLWLGLPSAPLWMAIIRASSEPLQSWRGSMRRARDHIAEMRRIGAIRRLIEQGSGPNDVRIEGACTHCGRCCLNGRCVFVTFDDGGQSRCQIHGNWFFRFLACGRYPISARDIATYDCPSFRAVPRPRGAGAVIPIRPLTVRQRREDR